jgi:D-alanyl-D-alanine dipeptidase
VNLNTFVLRHRVTLSDDIGRPLDLGADFDQFTQAAHLSHFEAMAKSSLNASNRNRRRLRRRVLYWAMTAAGFAPYRFEFWHFEHKTLRAAAHFGHNFAEFGPAVPWAASLT